MQKSIFTSKSLDSSGCDADVVAKKLEYNASVIHLKNSYFFQISEKLNSFNDSNNIVSAGGGRTTTIMQTPPPPMPPPPPPPPTHHAIESKFSYNCSNTMTNSSKTAEKLVSNEMRLIDSSAKTTCYNEFIKLKRNSKSEENLLNCTEKDGCYFEEAASEILRNKCNSWEDQTEFKEKTEFLFGKLTKVAEIKSKNKQLIDCSDRDCFKAELKNRVKSGSKEDLLENDSKMMPPLQSQTSVVDTDSDGLIVPKKLANPCLESSDRKNLHRELMFNQKIGKSVLNQKTELQKALQKQKERQQTNAHIFQQQQQQSTEHNTHGLAGELGRVISQRAQRLESLQNGHANQQDEINNQLNPEYLNARAKLRATVDLK